MEQLKKKRASSKKSSVIRKRITGHLHKMKQKNKRGCGLIHTMNEGIQPLTKKQKKEEEEKIKQRIKSHVENEHKKDEQIPSISTKKPKDKMAIHVDDTQILQQTEQTIMDNVATIMNTDQWITPEQLTKKRHEMQKTTAYVSCDTSSANVMNHRQKLGIQTISGVLLEAEQNYIFDNDDNVLSKHTDKIMPMYKIQQKNQTKMIDIDTAQKLILSTQDKIKNQKNKTIASSGQEEYTPSESCKETEEVEEHENENEDDTQIFKIPEPKKTYISQHALQDIVYQEQDKLDNNTLQYIRKEPILHTTQHICDQNCAYRLVKGISKATLSSMPFTEDNIKNKQVFYCTMGGKYHICTEELCEYKTPMNGKYICIVTAYVFKENVMSMSYDDLVEHGVTYEKQKQLSNEQVIEMLARSSTDKTSVAYTRNKQAIQQKSRQTKKQKPIEEIILSGFTQTTLCTIQSLVALTNILPNTIIEYLSTNIQMQQILLNSITNTVYTLLRDIKQRTITKNISNVNIKTIIRYNCERIYNLWIVCMLSPYATNHNNELKKNKKQRKTKEDNHNPTRGFLRIVAAGAYKTDCGLCITPILQEENMKKILKYFLQDIHYKKKVEFHNIVRTFGLYFGISLIPYDEQFIDIIKSQQASSRVKKVPSTISSNATNDQTNVPLSCAQTIIVSQQKKRSVPEKQDIGIGTTIIVKCIKSYFIEIEKKIFSNTTTSSHAKYISYLHEIDQLRIFCNYNSKDTN